MRLDLYKCEAESGQKIWFKPAMNSFHIFQVMCSAKKQIFNPYLEPVYVRLTHSWLCPRMEKNELS